MNKDFTDIIRDYYAYKTIMERDDEDLNEEDDEEELDESDE